MGAKTFTTIAISGKSVEEIDKVVKSKRFGYSSRLKFIKEPVRKLLKEISE